MEGEVDQRPRVDTLCLVYLHRTRVRPAGLTRRDDRDRSMPAECNRVSQE